MLLHKNEESFHNRHALLHEQDESNIEPSLNVIVTIPQKEKNTEEEVEHQCHADHIDITVLDELVDLHIRVNDKPLEEL